VKTYKHRPRLSATLISGNVNRCRYSKALIAEGWLNRSGVIEIDKFAVFADVCLRNCRK